jgi:hypothetical protein
MNHNQHTVKLLNAAGLEREYSEIPDLWHIARAIRDGEDMTRGSSAEKFADMVIDVWHMAHDYRDAITRIDKAEITHIDGIGIDQIRLTEYPVEDWAMEVANGDTRQSYSQWVESQREYAKEEA